MSRLSPVTSRPPRTAGHGDARSPGTPISGTGSVADFVSHARYGHRLAQISVSQPPVPRDAADEEELQRKAEGAPAPRPNVPVAVGGGAALSAPVRGKMERSFGHSFADVRIHSGGEAGQVGALAYTRGTDIHFQPGLYDSDSLGGQELLGHELTHVVQQRAGRVSSRQDRPEGFAPINADSGLEAEADTMGARAARGESAFVSEGDAEIQLKADPGAPIQCKGFFDKLFGGGPASKPEDKMTDEALLPDYSKDGADQGNINSVDLVTYSQNIGSYPTGYFKSEQEGGDLGMAAKAVGVRDDDLRTANRAVASSKVDDLLGLDAVAKTRHAEHNGKTGSVSEQAPGRQVRSLQDKPVTDPGMIKTLQENSFLLEDSGGDVKYAKDSNGNYSEKDAVSRHNYFDYSRPETQKGFNNLQWEDALTGQMDRHGGNIFVDDLTGKVTGIDNDAAFGGDRTARDPANLAKYGPDGESGFRPGKEGHNLGLPQMIDAETAQRFKDLNGKDLKKQLGGELSKEEIEATLQRLKHIKGHIKGLEKSGMVVGAKDKEGTSVGQHPAWDASTLDAEKRNAKFSYLGHAATSYDSASDPNSGRQAEAAHEVDAVKAASASELNRKPRLQRPDMVLPPSVPPSTADVQAPAVVPPHYDPAMALLMQSRMNDPIFAPNSSLPETEEAPLRSRSLSGAYGIPIPAPALPDAPALGGRAGEGPTQEGRSRALSGPYGLPISAPFLADAPALGGSMAQSPSPKKGIASRLQFFEELAHR